MIGLHSAQGVKKRTHSRLDATAFRRRAAHWQASASHSPIVHGGSSYGSHSCKTESPHSLRVATAAHAIAELNNWGVDTLALLQPGGRY
jgi:hypothetical protein